MRISKQQAGHKFTSAGADIRRVKRKNSSILPENIRLGIYVKIPLFSMPHCEEGRGLGQDKIRPASSGTGSPVLTPARASPSTDFRPNSPKKDLKKRRGLSPFGAFPESFPSLFFRLPTRKEEKILQL
jgi:hypothetical protein